MIKVTYDGRDPDMCRGVLTILNNNDIVYQKNNCISSDCLVYKDECGNICITNRNLSWRDSGMFKESIVHLVYLELDKRGQCSGCIA